MSKFRIGSFNVQNLFERPKAMNLGSWEEGRPVLEKHAEVNELLNKAHYSAATKDKILELLTDLGLSGRDDGGEFVRLRQVRGKLLKRPPGKDPVVIVDGRDQWIGWVELTTEPVDDLAMQHTAMVIRDIRADVLGVIEAEDRVSLNKFQKQTLKLVKGKPYEQVMLIDGNDDRGIDVALMARPNFEVIGVRSHVNDVDSKGRRIFSRDCPEFIVDTPGGKRMALLVNHLKSKGYGKKKESDAKRKAQAKRIAEIYGRLQTEGYEDVAIVGDFNDTPGSDTLDPLMHPKTDLRDISEHPSFIDEGRPGTFANGTKSQKIDYILLSPSLFDRVEAGGIWRKGVWGGKNGDLWDHYPSMTESVHQASDHHAVFAELRL